MAVVLGLDATGDSISVAISDAGIVTVELLLRPPSSALASLAPSLRDVLHMSRTKLSGLELLAVTTGPGSWAGIRIGIETAKMLSIAARLPLVGVSSLRALAASLGGTTDMPVLAILDAKRSRVYAAVYDCRLWVPAELKAPAVVECSLLGTLVNDCCWVVGDTHLLSDVSRTRCLPGSSSIRAGTVALIGEAEWKNGGAVDPAHLLPDYLQPALPGAP